MNQAEHERKVDEAAEILERLGYIIISRRMGGEPVAFTITGKGRQALADGTIERLFPTGEAK